MDELKLEPGWLKKDVDAAAAKLRLQEAAPSMLTALKAAAGYLLNAKIDLETGAPKKTAIATIEGGLEVVRAAIDKAEESAA